MRKITLLFVLCSFLSLSLSAQVVTDGLTLYYGFESDAADGSSNGNDGVAYKSKDVEDSIISVPITEGIKGNCFDLTAGNVLVKTPENIFDPAAGDFTVAMWVYQDTGQTANNVYMNQQDNAEGESGGKGRSVLFYNASKDTSGSFIGNKNTWIMAPSPDLKWHHLAVTLSDTVLTLYLNGSESNSASVTAEKATGALCIGSNKKLKNWVDGKIDEVYLFSKALTEAEIGKLYADTTVIADTSDTTSTSVLSMANTNTISVYNTMSGEVQIIKQNAYAKGTLRIADMLGKVVYTKSLEQCPARFMIDEKLAPGYYILYLDGVQTYTKKLFIN